MIAQPVMQKWKAWNKKYYNIRVFPPVEVEMNVPSGKIIIENDIRNYWPEAEDDFDVNETLGLKLTTETYGRHGMFHGFVGNSCPGVYRDGDLFHIGNQGQDDDYDKVVGPIPGEYVGGVITDLWWYCVADLDDYLARGGTIEKNWAGPVIVDVTPGRYVLKHHYGIGKREEYDHRKKEVFATFERTEAPLNKWIMPEEPLYKELPRILTEIDHFHHEYKSETDEFSLLMTVRGRGRYKKYEPKPEIRDWDWHRYFAFLGKLVRVKFPAQLANEARYDEIAVMVKKQTWAELKRDREHKQRMRKLKKLEKKQTPEQRARANKILREILDDMEKERDK
jgi:hypothetical protein